MRCVGMNSHAWWIQPNKYASVQKFGVLLLKKLLSPRLNLFDLKKDCYYNVK